jgi:uncharacterized SAM-binding protein YcdF (DUF218 family)
MPIGLSQQNRPAHDCLHTTTAPVADSGRARATGGIGTDRIGIALALLGVLALLAIAGRTLGPKGLSWLGHWLAQPTKVDHADAIVVLGGNMERIHQGIALYKHGLAPELWHTGNTPTRGESIVFAQFAIRLAIEQGVPAQAIHLLATTSTWEDGQQVISLARERNLESILIVTDWYHSRRALCVLTQQATDRAATEPKPTLYYASTMDIPYGPEDWWRYSKGWTTVLGELAKMGYYGLRYGISPQRCMGTVHMREIGL